jgi:2-oxoglutarate ferredoxin oxidoreductase subunit alpha
MAKPKWEGVSDAEFTLIGWGSTYGVIREAADLLHNEGVETNRLHLGEIWPFPREVVSELLNNGTKSIVIENNATAQMASLIKLETGHEVDGMMLKFDGRPFSPEEIVNRLKKEAFEIW